MTDSNVLYYESNVACYTHVKWGKKGREYCHTLCSLLYYKTCGNILGNDGTLVVRISMAGEFEVVVENISFSDFTKPYPKVKRRNMTFSIKTVCNNSLSHFCPTWHACKMQHYRGSSHYAHFGTWKKPCYMKFVLVGL